MTKDPITIARENIEAGNAQDWPRFKATLTDGVVYDEVGTGRKINGADQWVEAYKGWFQAFPDVQGKISNAFASGDTAIVELTWDGTPRRPRRHHPSLRKAPEDTGDPRPDDGRWKDQGSAPLL